MLHRSRVEWAAFLLFAALVGYQAFWPPVVGLANNGDFGKIIGVFNLTMPAEDESKFLVLTYTFDVARYVWFGFVSSEHLLAAVAVLLNAPFSNRGTTFDVRWIGLVHAVLYAFAFFLFQPLLRALRPWARIAAYAVVILVFTDVFYVLWINTFFMDAAALVFFLLIAVLYARSLAWGRRADFIACVICAALFASAKAQHCLLAVPIAVLIAFTRPSSVARAAGATAAAVIIAAAAIPWFIKPPGYGPEALYDTVFYEILPASASPDADLQELGLDATYRPWIGTYAFQDGVPIAKAEFAREFSRRTSYVRVGLFLLRHRARAFGTLTKALGYAGRLFVPAGNFPRSSGLPENTESQTFRLWSGAKQHLFEGHGTRYFSYFLVVCALWGCSLIGRERNAVLAGLCLCLISFLSLGIAAFGDALDYTRHFFFFNFLTDVILVSAIVAILFHIHPESFSPSKR